MKSLSAGAIALALLSARCATDPQLAAPAAADGGTGADTAVIADSGSGDVAPGADPGASDSGPPPAADGSTDELPAPPGNVPPCGAGPYQLVTLGARNPMAAANQRDLAGVRITFKHCPGTEVVTNAEGKAQVNLTAGVETWILFEAPKFVPWLCGEMLVNKALGGQGLTASMLSEALVSSFLTSYRSDKPLLYVKVQAGRSNAPEACRSSEGVAISVKGHPEAVVLYREVGSNAPFVMRTGTTTEGVALVTGLPASFGTVELVATKAGCPYVAAYGDANTPGLVPILRAPLQNGALTYQTINPERAAGP